MFWKCQMNMKHINCAVHTHPVHVISWFLKLLVKTNFFLSTSDTRTITKMSLSLVTLVWVTLYLSIILSRLNVQMHIQFKQSFMFRFCAFISFTLVHCTALSITLCTTQIRRFWNIFQEPKVGWRMSVTNYFKDHRRFSIHLWTIMSCHDWDPYSDGGVGISRWGSFMITF